MSYEDTIRALKVVSTVALGQFSGASTYIVLTTQPSLVEHKDVVAASKLMRSILDRSYFMPILSMVSASSSLAVYFKTRGTPAEDTFWLASGGLMLGLIPYTVSLIGPINLQFRQEEHYNDNNQRWSGLLSDWLTFHTPRAILAVTLFSISVYKLVK